MLGLSLVIINRDIKEYCFPFLNGFFLICSNSIIFPRYIYITHCIWVCGILQN